MEVELELELSKQDIQDAIADGVERAMWKMITGITDMPSSDFWMVLERAIENAFIKTHDKDA